MKKAFQLQALFIFSALLFTSCGNKTDENSGDSEVSENTTETTSKSADSDVIYSRKGDCDSFMQSLDLSSLCFTDEKVPEYEVEISQERNCQYEITPNDNNSDIHISILFSDYENSIFSDDEDPDMPKIMFKETFKQKRKSKVLYSKTTDVNDLGDDAFIGFNSMNKTKELAVRLSNVSFTIHLGRTDSKKSCLMSDSELIKFARLILDGIKS